MAERGGRTPKKAVLLASLMLAAIGIILASDGGQTTVQTIDGVAIVKNGKRPSPPPGEPSKLVLEPLFTVGGDSNAGEFFSVIAITVRNDGSILVLDNKDCVVKAFDANGRFLFSFGKKGQGPGDLNGPTGLTVMPSGEIIVADGLNRRLAVFSASGKFVKTQSPPQILRVDNLSIGPGDRIAARVPAPAGGKLGYEIKIFDRDFKPIKTLARIELPDPQKQRIDLLASGPALLYALDERGFIYTGSPNGYMIRVFDFNGRLVRTIEREYDPIPVGKDDRDRMMRLLRSVPGAAKSDPTSRFAIPDVLPPYSYFVVNREGQLLVRTFEKSQGKKGDYFYDFFGIDGRFIYHGPLAGNLIAWRDDRLYGLSENDDGFEILKCFRVRWE